MPFFVITNDTMAAHLSVSCNVPVIIIANGINAIRFSDYAAADIENVYTIYPKMFLKFLNKNNKQTYRAVSKDIQSIQPETVFNILKKQKTHLMQQALISIVLATYNGEKIFARAARFSSGAIL